MNSFHNLLLVMRNIAIFMVVGCAGLAIGGAIGMPVWLQGICLLPAGYLYNRLSGHAPPVWWKVAGFMVLLAGFLYIEPVVFSRATERSQGSVFVFFLALSPLGPGASSCGRLYLKTPRNDDQPAAKTS